MRPLKEAYIDLIYMESRKRQDLLGINKTTQTLITEIARISQKPKEEFWKALLFCILKDIVFSVSMHHSHYAPIYLSASAGVEPTTHPHPLWHRQGKYYVF